MKANFTSLRGPFKFNTNHYPIQDFYQVKVAQRADGKFETQIDKKVFAAIFGSVRQRLPDEMRKGAGLVQCPRGSLSSRF